ncbi:hypothetical protein SDC9_188448 [bioreactor metagenome]|uniref:Uncharacterized protein n=1 Tax=bioreactor metagenome TaxID=1076179 RepID=A0A645HPE0_9ZZZZ
MTGDNYMHPISVDYIGIFSIFYSLFMLGLIELQTRQNNEPNKFKQF